jgi:predicted PurR-regulated permease PerM
LTGIFRPFLISLGVSYLLYAPCTRVEKFYSESSLGPIKKNAAFLGVITVYIIFIGLIGTTVGILFPIIAKNLSDFYRDLPSMFSQQVANIQNFLVSMEKFGAPKVDVNLMIQKISSFFSSQFEFNDMDIDKVKLALSRTWDLVSIFVDIIISLIASIHILSARGAVRKTADRLGGVFFSEHAYFRLSKYVSITNIIFQNYIRCMVIDSTIVGIATFAALAMMKVKFSLALGALLGASNIVPVFGAPVAVVVIFLVTIFTAGLKKAVFTLLVILILQQIDANIVQPAIVGNGVDINPFWAIFGVVVGGSLFGPLGILLSVPALASVKVVLSDVLTRKEIEMGKIGKIVPSQTK